MVFDSSSEAKKSPVEELEVLLLVLGLGFLAKDESGRSYICGQF